MGNKIKKAGFILFATLFFCLAAVGNVRAEEGAPESSKRSQEELLKEFDFGEINAVLDDIFPEEKLDFGDLVKELTGGNIKGAVQMGADLFKDKLFYEIHYNKDSMVHILLIAVIAAVFTNFSSVFQNQQISETGFYILYILLMTICISSFQVITQSVTDSLNVLLTFMKILGPVYFLGVAFAAGSVSAVAFYNLVLLLIFLVELLILNFLIPLIHVEIMIHILNNLSQEDYLSKLGELLHTVISWTLKTMLACVIGMNVIQGLLSPAIDSLKHSVVTRSAEAIPGIGDALGGVAEVVLGTAVLIKNGIGVAGAVICVVICLIPIIQIAVMTLMYKLAAALIQPVSDKRIVGCISSMGDGCQLVLRTVFTTGVLFLLTIAVVAQTAGS